MNLTNSLPLAAVKLSDVIGQIESGGNPNAIRFEPLVFASLTNGAMTPAHAQIVSTIQAIHCCNVKTAQVIYSTSWGLYQVMGFNLYDNGTQESVFHFCADRIEQARVFDAKCSTWNINIPPANLASDPAQRLKFARKYNGADAYADRIASTLKSFGFVVA
jgi:hypothetical protein